MSEKRKDCPSCNIDESLVRIPNLVTKKVKQKEKVGDIVKEFIKDAKQEVKEEKEKMKKEEYKS
jgi:hemerythrin